MKNLSFTLVLCLLPFTNLWSQAPEPPSQPSSLLFSSVKTYSMVLSFTATVADGYLILKSATPITDVPVDGITYEKGQGLSSSKVMYSGANNINAVREVVENTRYYFKVFAYNGSGSSINYRQTNPLYDSVSTPAADEGTYYMAVDSTSPSFINDLTSVISNHTLVAYTSYRGNIIPAIFERDTTSGQAVVNCEYSNTTTIYTPPFDFVAQQYNREHALPKSWMLTGGNTLNPDGADYFNLLLTRDVPNGIRSNNPLGVVVNPTQTFGESKFGPNTGGNPVFEPKDDRKGDAARAMFYQMVCYNGNGGNWGLDNLLSQANEQEQGVLKQWHQQDPPDKFERTKNEYIYSIQHNRNPFVDHPGWVECINFDSLLRTAACALSTSIEENAPQRFADIYPNPAAATLNIELAETNGETSSVFIFDLTGRLIYQTLMLGNKVTLSTHNFDNGNYLLKVISGHKTFFQRIQVLN